MYAPEPGAVYVRFMMFPKCAYDGKMRFSTKREPSSKMVFEDLLFPGFENTKIHRSRSSAGEKSC